MLTFQSIKKLNIKAPCKGFILLIALFTLAGIFFGVNAVYASDLKPTDLERIQIGKSVPDFNLESVDGNWVKLSNYKNKKNVILIFYRGYW